MSCDDGPGLGERRSACSAALRSSRGQREAWICSSNENCFQAEFYLPAINAANRYFNTGALVSLGCPFWSGPLEPRKDCSWWGEGGVPFPVTRWPQVPFPLILTSSASVPEGCAHLEAWVGG